MSLEFRKMNYFEKQFQFCKVCQRNHQQGERHVFSKSHKKGLEKILHKFSLKVDLMQTALATHQIVEHGREEKFWCYVCQAEFSKHYLLENCAGKDGGIAAHFASSEHKHQMEIFAKLHRLSAEKLTKFALEDKDFDQYRGDIVRAARTYFASLQEKLNQEAERIAAAEEENHQIAVTGQRESFDAQRPECTSQQKPSTSRGHQSGMRTIDAKGEGLTCIKIQDDDGDRVGNVHSGAVPPWLRRESTVATSADVIGPTIDDLHMHQRAERRAKLPSSRVGADFSRQNQLSRQQPKNWKPSFSHLWSKKRTSQKTSHKASEALRHTPQAELPPLKRMKFGDQQ